MNFIDMHIHLQDYKTNCATDIVTAAREGGICRFVCASTSEKDWPEVAALAEKYPHTVVPAFGIHPWYAVDAAKGWQIRLREQLLAFPTALVGECGLDGLREGMAVQTEVFAEELALAKELKRPFVIHAVKAVPELEGFWRQMPERFMVHSFNGHPDHLRPILKNGGYVSFSASILRNRNGAEIVRMVPADRLLLETDGPYQGPQKGLEQTPLFLPRLLMKIANWRQQDPAELAAMVLSASEEFIDGK